MAYVDPQTVHNPSVGGTATAAWGDAVRDALQYLSAPPACKAVRSGTQLISNATDTRISFNGTDEWDADDWGHTAMHDPSGDPEDININDAGIYVVTAYVEFAANSTGYRTAFIHEGAFSSALVTKTDPSPSASIESRLNLQCRIEKSSGQFRLGVHQTSGGNLFVNEAWMAVRWVSRAP